MNSTRNRAVGEYLRELQRSMRDLPAKRREEILAEIEEHITTGLSEFPSETDSDVRNVLERLGDPHDIAAEARDRLGLRSARPRTPWLEVIALVFLVIPPLGWIVGIVLLWVSGLWTKRDKVIATILVPGGGFVLPFLLTIGSGPGGIGDGPVEAFVLWGAFLFGIPTAIYLGIRLRSNIEDERGDLDDLGHGEVGVGKPSRERRWLIGGVLVLVVLGAIVGAFLMNSDGSRHAITEDQFSRVGIGDSKEKVSQALAGPGEGGSKVSGLDPQAVEVELRPGQEQYDDCWSYSVDGPSLGPGSEASVCFIADEVVYTVFLSD